MSSIPGVITAESGYANGNVEAPTYERVCQGDTMPQIDFGEWNTATYNGNITLIVLLSCLAAALIFCIAGAVKNTRR